MVAGWFAVMMKLLLVVQSLVLVVTGYYSEDLTMVHHERHCAVKRLMAILMASPENYSQALAVLAQVEGSYSALTLAIPVPLFVAKNLLLLLT